MNCVGRGGQIRTDDPLLPKQMRYQAALRPDFLQSYPTRPHDSRRWREWRLGSETGAKMLAELRRNSCTGTQAAAVSRTLHRCTVSRTGRAGLRRRPAPWPSVELAARKFLKIYLCAVSMASATRSIVSSLKWGPMICTPMGSPALVSPHGTLIPQIPARLAATE